MLVDHDDEYRRAWMFPRNIRSIPPWKVMQILVLLMHVTEGLDWGRNKKAQREFTRALENLGLKAPGYQRDANSGGPRTYLAQLESLGLVFTREEDSTLWPTLAGEALIREYRPLEVLQTQLLRHQYPSHYSMGKQVRMHPEVRIRPFAFLLQLMLDPDLGGLSNQEFGIPVVYGHTSDCLSLCKAKILAWRDTGGNGLSMIDSPATDLVTPRTREKRREMGSWEKAWQDMKDVGNTFKNALESNCLITLDPVTRRFVIAPDAVALVESFIGKEKKLLPYSGEESFQRAYGRFDRLKDTRTLAPNRESISVQDGTSVILARFMAHCRSTMVTGTPDDWIKEQERELGFTSDQIRAVIGPHLGQSISIFEQTYLDLSRGGSVAGLDFEKATAELFRQKLNIKATLTGQKKRAGVGGFADILLTPDEPDCCAIVDTKASGTYALGSADYHKMAGNYVKNVDEIAEGRRLEFCGYVAGGFSPTIEGRLAALGRETGVPAMAITAKSLLTLARDAGTIRTNGQTWALLKQGGLVSVN